MSTVIGVSVMSITSYSTPSILTITLPVASAGNPITAVPSVALTVTKISGTTLSLTTNVTVLDMFPSYLLSPANVALIV